MQMFPPPAKQTEENTWDVQLETVTPEKAKQLLASSNFDNRKLRLGTVQKYASTMANGAWRTSPETLIVAETGRLLNGQHRLHAIVQSGVACTFLFVRGVDESVYGVLDRGAMRSAADALQKNPRLIEEATLLGRIAYQRPRVTDDAVAQIVPLIETEFERRLAVCGTQRGLFSSAPFRLAALARAKDTGQRDQVYDLYRKLVLGDTENLPPVGHAIMRRFVSGTMPKSSGFVGQTERLCIAWALFDPARHDLKLIRGMVPTVAIPEILQAVGVKNTKYDD